MPYFDLLKIRDRLDGGIGMRHKERELLQGIAAVTSLEFAEQAADALDSRKHPYGFMAYLELLRRLHALVSVGVSNHLALEIVQACDPSFDGILLSHW